MVFNIGFSQWVLASYAWRQGQEEIGFYYQEQTFINGMWYHSGYVMHQRKTDGEDIRWSTVGHPITILEISRGTITKTGGSFSAITHGELETEAKEMFLF